LLALPWAARGRPGPPRAARQLDHRAVRNGTEALGVHGVQAVGRLVIMAREQVAVAVQGECDRGVPGPDADLLGIGAGGDPQGHGGEPQVVGPQRHQPNRPDRREPDFDPEIRRCSTPPLSAVDTQASASPTSPRCSANSSTTALGRVTMRRPARILSGPHVQLAADLDHDLGHVQRARSRSTRRRRSPASSPMRSPP
jgi:hypothetical protein